MLLAISLSFFKIVVTLVRFTSCFHDQDSRAHHQIYAKLLHWELAIYFSIMPSNKMTPYITPLSKCLSKNEHGLEKKERKKNGYEEKEKKNIYDR